MNTLIRSFLLLIACAAAAALHAADGPEPSDAEKAFFRDLKKAALEGDRAWVIAHVSLPVRVTIEGRARMLATTEELEAAYPQIMTLDAVNAIRRQSSETLVRTRQGVMVGDGVVWLDEDPATPAGKEPRICIVAFGNSG